MEKVKFTLDTQENVDFYVLEQTKLGGSSYLLVTDVPEGDGEALILKEVSVQGEKESVYEIVSEETEMAAVASVFENLLEDVELR